MIKLKQDRLGSYEPTGKKDQPEIFLHKGYYDKLRIIPGLGWLVAVPGFRDKIQTTIIRFAKGEDADGSEF